MLTHPDAVDICDNLAFDPVVTGGNILAFNSTNDASPNILHYNEILTNLYTSASSQSCQNAIPIKDQLISLPSNGNTSNFYHKLELNHCIAMAEQQLNHVQNLIAEKNFQFSHVIRVSPQKGITT